MGIIVKSLGIFILAGLCEIGGGYMAGRFLTAPFSIALVILSQYNFMSKRWLLPIVCLFGLIEPTWQTIGEGPWGEKKGFVLKRWWFCALLVASINAFIEFWRQI